MYKVQRVRVIQYGLVESLIKLITGSNYCHAMIFISNDDHFEGFSQVFYGLDVAGVEIYSKHTLPYKVDIDPKVFEIKDHPFDEHEESLRYYTYSHWSNFYYLIHKVKPLRRFIRYLPGKANCVAWVARYLSLGREAEHLSPGDLFKGGS